MNRQNWIYIYSISAVALFLAIPALSTETIQPNQWKAFFILVVLSMAAQVVSSAMPRHRLRIPQMIFFFTGVLLLQPLLILTLILLITIVDWEHDRREGNPSVRDGYLLPLNLGTHTSAAFATYWLLVLFQSEPLWVLSVGSVVTIVLAALTYALFHHLLGHGQSLAQGVDWDESGLLDVDTIFVKVAILFVGYGLAILWVVNPWLLLIGLIPGLYYYQIHVIPALKIEAHTDAKTNLSNMRHFDELFSTELARASRMNLPLSMIMVDVDDLGLINNTYGHLTGDGALLTVSAQIRLQIKQNDIAARLGGEEFAIVLPEADMQTAATFADSLRQQIAAARFDITNQDEQLQTTVSIGVASFPQHGLTTLELIHAADIAMYQAKSLGKNQVILADDVKDILEPAIGHRESTEILNYRAAFSPPVEQPPSGTVGKPRFPNLHNHASMADSGQLGMADGPRTGQYEAGQYEAGQYEAGQYEAGRSEAEQREGGRNEENRSPNDSELSEEQNGELSAAHANRLEQAGEPGALHRTAHPPKANTYSAGNHRPSVAHSLNISSSGSSWHQNHEGQPNHDVYPAHRLHATNEWRKPTDDLGIGLGIDSAVTKYQSELLNGPPTTEIVEGMLKRQDMSPLDEEQKRIPALFAIPTICAAVAAVSLGLFYSTQPINLLSLVVFGIVALIVQLLQQSMYESSTVSVSAAVILAGTFVEGMPGLLTTCSIVVLVHALQHHTPLYKAAFNWSTHILAGLAPMAVYLLGLRGGIETLTLVVLLTLVSAILYYAIESAFIASAIALIKGQNVFAVWGNQFRWLAVHYMVAGFIALSMALAFLALGPWGVVAFAMPVLLIYFAQKQYVVRTEQSTRKLNHMNRELSKANVAITTANRSFQRLTDELFIILSKIIDARDPDVHGHAAQVANYAEAIAHELGIKQDEIEKVRHGALLHDIGKIGISELILHKPGPLTDTEYETIKSHPVLGADFLETCQSLRSVAPYVRHHHEWWNGKGYPAELYQDQIPMGARIIAVCDAVEAMTSDRPYRKGLSLGQVISELEKGKGIQFDPLVIDAFIKVLRREGKGYLLNTASRDTHDPQAA